MTTTQDTFDDIRPYNQAEVVEAIQRIANHHYLPAIVAFIFPDYPFETFKKEFTQLKSTADFQRKIMDVAIRTLTERTSSELTFSGFEQLEASKNYLYIANHRDILLDSAIFQILLYKHGLDTSEITFGNNLMKGEFVIDIGKINKMFKIIREGNFREFYQNAARFSAYMRYTITEKKESVWIAQRNGRTKDGNDATETAVLKMLALSSKRSFIENIAELNITPLCISYEFEPCDFLKTREMYVSKRVKYVKTANEDLESIIKGIMQWKGRINLTVTPTITSEELEMCEKSAEKFKTLTQLIDQRIYENYQLWPNHYIAYDLLTKKDSFKTKYTMEERDAFIHYMNDGLKNIEGDVEELRGIFLSIYANPIRNKMDIQ